MSTRGAIARPISKEQGGGFEGRYHHWDSYPSGLGAKMHQIYSSHFGGDLEAMLKVLIDDHRAGWSTICKNWDAPAGYAANDWRLSHEEQEKLGPQCYCHGDRSESECTFTHHDSAGCGVEYVYVLYEKDDVPTMDIFTAVSVSSDGKPAKMVGAFGSGDAESDWLCVVRLDLRSSVTAEDWEAFDQLAAHPGGIPSVVMFQRGISKLAASAD